MADDFGMGYALGADSGNRNNNDMFGGGSWWIVIILFALIFGSNLASVNGTAPTA